MCKCAECGQKYDDDQIIVLAEYSLGFGLIEDYYMCITCYDMENSEL